MVTPEMMAFAQQQMANMSPEQMEQMQKMAQNMVGRASSTLA